MEGNQKGIKKAVGKKRWICLVTALLISSLCMFGCSKSTPQPAAQQPAQTEQKQEPKKPAIDWTTATINADNVKLALTLDAVGKPASVDANFPKDIFKVEVQDVKEKAGQKTIIIYYAPNIPPTNATEFVKVAGGTAIMGSSILFTNPKVEKVTFYAQIPDKNTAGEFSDGVDLFIDREYPINRDWKSIATLHASDPGYIFREANGWFIFDELMKGLDQSAVKVNR